MYPGADGFYRKQPVANGLFIQSFQRATGAFHRFRDMERLSGIVAI
jgi:hypothetical protein